MFFPTFSTNTWIGQSFIGKEVNLSQKSIYSSEEKPLDLRIANYVIYIFGGITSFELFSLPCALFSYSIIVVRNLLFIPGFSIDPDDLERLAESAAEEVFSFQLVQGALLLGIVTSAIFASLLVYRHYMHPEFYPSDYKILDYVQFEHSLKLNLEKQKLNPSKFEIEFLGFSSRSNVEVLCREIVCRSILLVSSFAKTCFLAIKCLVSPVSLLTVKVESPSPTWERFCKQGRHLAADLFEFMGVIVCSTLLLPFDRRNSPNLINAQAWIEKKAEWISGREELVIAIQKIIDDSKAKKKLLLQIRRVLEVSKKDINDWVNKAIDFDDIIHTIDIVTKRRIYRSYNVIPSLAKQKLDAKLEEFVDIISDRIPEALKKQQMVLTRLRQLCSEPNHELIDTAWNVSDSLEVHLELFQKFQTAINQTIDELHQLHDPTNELDKEIKNFIKMKNDTFSSFEKDYLLQLVNQHVKKSISEFIKEIREHFFFAEKKLVEVMFFYFYRNVTELDEPFSPNFANDLKEQLAECRSLFEQACLSYETTNDNFLNSEKALRILNLPKTASQSEIKKAYYRLSLICHPDKGGNQNVFNTINKAYEFLKNN